jgi:hypothetical protein
MKVNQISVFLENKSGRLADVTRVMAENKINIRALCIADTIDYGLLRLIVNDPDKAKEVLHKEGFTVTQTPVLALEIPDKPGGLAEVIAILAEKDINVEYIYAFVGKSGENAVVIFRVERIDEAVETLQQGGAKLLNGEQVYSM